MTTRTTAALLAICGLLAAHAPASAQTAPSVPPTATATPQAPRLRALDWTPFDAALQRTPADRHAAIDRLTAKATVVDLQAAMQARALRAEDLTLHLLARLQRHDERLRTCLELNPHALEEARAADTRRAAGQVRGLLDGIPVTLKDNIETAAPLHTTAGAAILLDHQPQRDAPLVAQLRAAGAVILCKANLSELAGVVTTGRGTGSGQGGFSAVGGQAANPHGPYPVSGSSAGSAAGVAAGLTVLSVGTETSGSLLSPGTLNGVVAMKPSRGLVDGAGVVPLVAFNDSPGPVGRSVTDVAALLGVIDTRAVDHVAGLRTDALDGVTVGVLGRDMAADPDNTPLLQAASASLVSVGARLRPASLVRSAAWGPPGSFLVYLSAGMRHDMMGYIAARVPGVRTVEDLIAYNAADTARRAPAGQGLLQMLGGLAAGMPVADYHAMAAQLRQAAADSLDAAFRSSGAEVLVSTQSLHAEFYATAGYPAITVPMGLRARGGALPSGVSTVGLPVGITFIGKPGEDARLLAWAYAFEQATNLRATPGLR